MKTRKRTPMKEEKTKVSGNGIGFFGVLFLIFLWLKLNPGSNFDTPVQDWSWWWVTAPLWGPLVLALAIFAVVFISYIVINIGNKNGR